jgi:thioredoxin 1
MIILNDDSFQQIITNNKTVLIDFFADWCGPCRIQGPIFEEASKLSQDKVFLKINVDKYPTIARQYGVMSIPTVCKIVDGKLSKKEVGVQSKDSLLNF